MVPACLLVRLLRSFPGLRGIPWGRELNWKMERQDRYRASSEAVGEKERRIIIKKQDERDCGSDLHAMHKSVYPSYWI